MKNAVEIKNLSKTYYGYRGKYSSIREWFSNIFKKDNSAETENKEESINNLKVLDDISFSIKTGEFVAIVGKNGSGKSTLLKILAGVYEAEGGSVKVNGNISPFLELGVGFNRELTAIENIYLNATILGLTPKEIRERLDSIIEFAEIEDFKNVKIKNFSSGMYARLAFSIAVQVEASVFLMDEVLAVGDADFQEKCLSHMQNLVKNGKTIIFVSHDLEDIKKHCSRAILLENGKIVMDDKPSKVIKEYKHE